MVQGGGVQEDGDIIYKGHIAEVERVGKVIQEYLEVRSEQEAGEGAPLFYPTCGSKGQFHRAEQASATLLENRL
jgi:hypothetical protein